MLFQRKQKTKTNPVEQLRPDSRAVQNFIEAAALDVFLELQDKLLDPKFAGLADLYSNPVENYYAKKGTANGEIQIFSHTNYFQGVVSRFRDASFHLPKGTSLVLLDEAIEENYISKTFDKPIIISPGHNNEEEVDNFFDDWHFYEYTIARVPTKKLQDTLFSSKQSEKTIPWLTDSSNFSFSKSDILLSERIHIPNEDMNVLEQISLKKILREHKLGLPFEYAHTSQDKQKQSLLEAIYRNAQGEINIADTSNHSLKGKEENRSFHMSSDYVLKQAKHIYNINTVLNSLQSVLNQYKK